MALPMKVRVLKRFPEAKARITERWADGSVQNIVVYVGDKPLFVPNGHTASYREAWRAAWFWCVRHPETE